jgi:hypothetical protein
LIENQPPTYAFALQQFPDCNEKLFTTDGLVKQAPSWGLSRGLWMLGPATEEGTY